MKGLWLLRGSNPPLYTNKAADVIIHKQTKKEYIRGERKIFPIAKLPKLIEDSDEYEFCPLTNSLVHR